jgi:hypothetical protein
LVERRPAAFRAVRARHRPLQIDAEQLQIDHRIRLSRLSPLAESCFSRSSTSKNPLDRASPPPAQTPPLEP